MVWILALIPDSAGRQEPVTSTRREAWQPPMESNGYDLPDETTLLLAAFWVAGKNDDRDDVVVVWIFG